MARSSLSISSLSNSNALGEFRGRKVVDRLADRVDRRLGGRGAENLVVEPGHDPLLFVPTARLARGMLIIGRFPPPPNRRWNGQALGLPAPGKSRRRDRRPPVNPDWRRRFASATIDADALTPTVVAFMREAA